MKISHIGLIFLFALEHASFANDVGNLKKTKKSSLFLGNGHSGFKGLFLPFC